MQRYLVLILVLLAAGAGWATTWCPSEATDPISGEKVAVHGIMSYGNYIYRWDSKYDLVFWPMTDSNWLWFSPKSGYAAFGSNFEKLPQKDKEHLSQWLKDNYNPDQPPKTHADLLAWLERVYGQRTMSEDFWCEFYRLMAYEHRDDPKQSIAYVKKALPLLEKQLKKNPKDMDRIAVLYLLGEYNRRLGKTDVAKSYFKQVKTAKYKDEDGKVKVGNPYFLELVKDREALLKQKA